MAESSRALGTVAAPSQVLRPVLLPRPPREAAPNNPLGRRFVLSPVSTHFLDLFACGLAFEISAAVVRALLFPTAPVGVGLAPIALLGAMFGGAFGAYLAGLNTPAVSTDRREIVFRSLFAGATGSFAALVTTYFVSFAGPGRITLAASGVLSAALIALWRSAYANYLLRCARDPVIVLGYGERERNWAVELDQMPGARTFVCGFVAESGPAESAHGAPPLLGHCNDVLSICEAYGIEEVVVVSEDAARRHVAALSALVARGLRVTNAATLTMHYGKRVPLNLVDNGWLLSTVERLANVRGTGMKRAVDVAVSLFGLSILAVILPVLYPLLKLDSPGPFFFTQDRVGLGGKVFRLYKIRTMSTRSDGVSRWAVQDGHRVTRLGAILRRFRIDELPQFWNVLRGEMSIVGPRPEQPSLAEELGRNIPHFSYRAMVLPGITGWAQIHQGYAASVEESAIKLSYDLYYLRHRSTLLDLDVIFRTAFVMLGRVGSR